MPTKWCRHLGLRNQPLSKKNQEDCQRKSSRHKNVSRSLAFSSKNKLERLDGMRISFSMDGIRSMDQLYTPIRQNIIEDLGRDI